MFNEYGANAKKMRYITNLEYGKKCGEVRQKEANVRHVCGKNG